MAVEVPSVDDQRTLGVIHLGWHSEFRDDESFRARLGTLVELVSQTLERVRLAEAEHRLVEDLQARTLRPIPTIAGLEVVGRYEPAAVELGMGGDWFEVVDLGSGLVGLVVGDVVGHGVESAAEMSQISAVIGTVLSLGTSLGTFFARVHDVAGSATPRFVATASVCVLDVATGLLRYVSAGHPAPVVRCADGSTVVLSGGRSPVVGMPPREVEPGEWVLEVGDTLFVYTDGLVERRGEDLDAGLDRLRGYLATLPDGDVDAQASGLGGAVHGGRTHRGRHRPRRAPSNRLLMRLRSRYRSRGLTTAIRGYVIPYGSDACFRSPGDGTRAWPLGPSPRTPVGGPSGQSDGVASSPVGARWLNDDEQQVWRSYLRMSRELLDQLDRELQAVGRDAPRLLRDPRGAVGGPRPLAPHDRAGRRPPLVAQPAHPRRRPARGAGLGRAVGLPDRPPWHPRAAHRSPGSRRSRPPRPVTSKGCARTCSTPCRPSRSSSWARSPAWSSAASGTATTRRRLQVVEHSIECSESPGGTHAGPGARTPRPVRPRRRHGRRTSTARCSAGGRSPATASTTASSRRPPSPCSPRPVAAPTTSCC